MPATIGFPDITLTSRGSGNVITDIVHVSSNIETMTINLQIQKNITAIAKENFEDFSETKISSIWDNP